MSEVCQLEEGPSYKLGPGNGHSLTTRALYPCGVSAGHHISGLGLYIYIIDKSFDQSFWLYDFLLMKEISFVLHCASIGNFKFDFSSENVGNLKGNSHLT